jgi:hypothetical protein
MATRPGRPGFHTVVPYLIVRDLDAMLASTYESPKQASVIVSANSAD